MSSQTSPFKKSVVSEATEEVKQDNNSVSTTSDDVTKAEKGETQWKPIYMVAIITFLSMLEDNLIALSHWPYMHSIDVEATSNFLGYAKAIYNSGNIVFTIVYSYWKFRGQRFRPPLVFSRILASIACFIYIFVEFLPSGRRYLLSFIWFLFGGASGCLCVLRNYMVASSSSTDRSKACSILVLSRMIAVISATLVQSTFAFVEYPGIQLISDKILFNNYTGPIWICALTNFIAIAVIMFTLPEFPKREEDQNESSAFSLQALKESLNRVKSMNLRWSLIITCWCLAGLNRLQVISNTTVLQPIMTVTFGWTSSYTVLMASVVLGVIGVLSILVSLFYALGWLSKLLSPRTAVLVSIVILNLMYFISFPYPFVGDPMPEYNETAGTGCNPSELPWCYSKTSSNWIVLMAMTAIGIGFSFPFIALGIDIIYSKVLGNIDQSLMQGLIVVFEDIILTTGPIYASSTFSYVGQDLLWGLNGGICFICLLLWSFYFSDLKKFS